MSHSDSPAPEMPCRACGRPMVERVNSHNGSTFMACTGFTERDERDQPACSETQAVPAYIVMRQMGAQELPGFDVPAATQRGGGR